MSLNKDFSAYRHLLPKSSSISELDPVNLADIAFRMRARDREEIYNGSGISCPFNLANLVYASSLFGFIQHDKTGPQGVLTFHVTISGVWTVGMFATEKWSNIFTSFSKHCKCIVQSCVESGLVRRVEARSLGTYPQAHRWLEWLGAKKECELRDWGLEGQTYFLYTWKISDYRRPHESI